MIDSRDKSKPVMNSDFGTAIAPESQSFFAVAADETALAGLAAMRAQCR
jgi:hypothetical protein